MENIEAKYRVYQGIGPKNPGSPSRKRCLLGIACLSRVRIAEAKALNRPPGKYSRKAEILDRDQAISRSRSVYLKE